MIAKRPAATGGPLTPPRQTDANLRALLRQDAGFSITADSNWQSTASRFVLPGFKVTRLPGADLGRAMALVEQAMVPATRHQIVAELVALKIKTRGRSQTDDDLDLELKIYAAELAAYPADVVVEGLRRAARESRWFPTWAELAEILDDLARDRRFLRTYLGLLATAGQPGGGLLATQSD